MASDASNAAPAGVLTATKLLLSLQVRPFCDDAGDQELTPEQEAALHAFLHEIMAAYFRLRMTVPQDKVLTLLDRRFAKAATERLRP